MTIYSGFSHWKWWFSIAMLVYQRVVFVENPIVWPWRCVKQCVIKIYILLTSGFQSQPRSPKGATATALFGGWCQAHHTRRCHGSVSKLPFRMPMEKHLDVVLQALVTWLFFKCCWIDILFLRPLWCLKPNLNPDIHAKKNTKIEN